MTQAISKKPTAKRPRLRVAARGAVTGLSLHAGEYSVNATQAKNQFGAILRQVRNAQPVFIEKHGAAQAVVLDIGSYRALVHQAREPHQVQLDALRKEFDALYASMQTPKSRKAVDQLSAASAEELNRVAALRAKARG